METDARYYFAILFDKICTAGERLGRSLRGERKIKRRVNGAAKSGGSFVRPKLCNIVHEKWGKQGEYGIFKAV